MMAPAIHSLNIQFQTPPLSGLPGSWHTSPAGSESKMKIRATAQRAPRM